MHAVFRGSKHQPWVVLIDGLASPGRFPRERPALSGGELMLCARCWGGGGTLVLTMSKPQQDQEHRPWASLLQDARSLGSDAAWPSSEMLKFFFLASILDRRASRKSASDTPLGRPRHFRSNSFSLIVSQSLMERAWPVVSGKGGLGVSPHNC